MITLWLKCHVSVLCLGEEEAPLIILAADSETRQPTTHDEDTAVVSLQSAILRIVSHDSAIRRLDIGYLDYRDIQTKSMSCSQGWLMRRETVMCLWE